VARLADVASYELGRTPPRKSSEYWSERDGIPWVTIGDMEPFSIVDRTAEKVSPRAADEVFQTPPVPKGTLLMSFKLTIGRTAVLGMDAYHNEAIIALRPTADVERDFLRFYLPTIAFAQHQDRAVKGYTLNRAKIDVLPVPVPPPGEQRAIAATLSTIQTAVEVQDKIVAALKELKAVTMAKLFREGLRGEPLKQTEIGEIPDSWNVVRIGDHCVISSGGTPSRDRPEYWNGSIPWVKTGEIDYHPILKAEERITEAGLASSSARLFPKGTLLMAMYGQGVTRGKVAFLEIEAATNQACAALFPDEKLDSGYLYSYCAFAYERIRELGHGANQKNLSADLIRAMPVPLPPSVEEQKEIYFAVKGVDSRLFAAETRFNRLRALFGSTLRQLMSGRVRVPLSVSLVPDTVKRQAAIGSFVATLVEQYQPDRLTMFGPPVPGSPRAFGDVGLLVEMPFRGLARDQAARIARDIPHDFSLDLLVRRPEELQRAREIGDRYLGGILARGRVLYARPSGAPARQPAEAEAAAEVPRRPPQVLSEETLRAIVRRIVEAVQPEKIILFGSAARGEMGPDSDVDLLVVKSGVHRRELAARLYRELADLPVPKDIIVATPEDLERHRDTIGLVYRTALREGRVVYVAA